MWLPLPVELTGLAGRFAMTKKSTISEIEGELRAAKETLAEISSRFDEFAKAQARLIDSGDLIGLARLKRDTGDIETELLAASDSVQALELRLAELQMAEYKPQFDKAHKTHLGAVKAEAAAGERLLAALDAVFSAATDMQDLSDEVAQTYGVCRELHNLAGLDHELRWPAPDGKVETQIDSRANGLRDELMRTIRLYQDRVPQFQSLEGIRFLENQQAEMAKNSGRWFR